MGPGLCYDPTPLILGGADEPARLAYLAALGLTDRWYATALRARIPSQQRADGGYPSDLDHSAAGLRETIQALLVLLDAGVEPGEDHVQRGLQFVLSHQDPCGGFRENPAVSGARAVMEVRTRGCITWLTASAVDLVVRTMGQGSPALAAAVSWLRSMQRPDGSWPMYAERPKGDPDSTAQIAHLLREIGGPDDPSYLASRSRLTRDLKEAVETARRGYWIADDGEQEPLDAYTLTFPVLSSLIEPPRRIQAGYDVKDLRVKTLMEMLIRMQRPDGGWRPFWTDGSCPRYSVVVVKALLATGAVSGEELRAKAEAWA